MDGLVETDSQRGRSDERDARAVTQATGAQIHNQWHECGGDVLEKTRVTDQSGKLGSSALQHLLTVVGFEVAVVGLVKGNQDGHNLTHGQ